MQKKIDEISVISEFIIPLSPSMQTWTRCYVKIEAIKCFPCYMKITFHKRQNYETDQEGLVFRINIPGLEVYPVSVHKFINVIQPDE